MKKIPKRIATCQSCGEELKTREGCICDECLEKDKMEKEINRNKKIIEEISFLNYLIEYPELCREKCKERINNLKLQITENKSGEKKMNKTSLQNLKDELEKEISCDYDWQNNIMEIIDKAFEKHKGVKKNGRKNKNNRE